jgi:proline iminopeptidase
VHLGGFAPEVLEDIGVIHGPNHDNLRGREGRTPVNATILDHDIFYTTRGQGPALLTLHGGPGLDHTYFLPWLDALAEGRKLILYDQLGAGRSERPSSFPAGGLDTWADEADALRAHLGAERMVLLGHSFGSYIALTYALRYPHRLDGLIICSGAPALDYPAVMTMNAAARSTPQQLEVFARLMSGPSASDEDWRRDWTAILPIYFHAFDPAIGAAMDANTIYSAAAYNHGLVQCLPLYNVTSRLGEIRVPTLLVSGRHDWISPPKQGGERLRDGIPGAQLEIFEKSGHFPFIEENERFLARVRAFLDELRTR